MAGSERIMHGAKNILSGMPNNKGFVESAGHFSITAGSIDPR